MIYYTKIVKFKGSLILSNISKRYLSSRTSSGLSYYSAVSTKPLIPDTIGQRLEYAAEKYGERDAHVFCETGHRLSFIKLKEMAEKVASGLLAIGLKRGDRIGVWAPNCLEWILTQYATGLIGVIQVNINPAYKVNELEYSLHKVGCKAIVMSERVKTQNNVEMINEICPELISSKPGHLHSRRLPHLKSVIVTGEKHHAGIFNFNQLEYSGDTKHKHQVEKLLKQLQSSDPINIQYTSGTTGFPKAVTLSHHMIVNNVYQVGQLLGYDKSHVKVCVQVPLYHCFGMVLGSISTVVHGVTAVYPGSTYNPGNSLKAISTEKCNSFYGTPTMYVDLLNHPNLSKHDLSSLNTGVMSGSTCPPELLKDCIERLNTKNIVVVYGMTETSPVVSASSIHDTLENRTQTVGKPLEHLECKLVNEKNEVVPLNEPGELLVRGYCTMIGYWNDKDKTEETFTPDRYLRTGDVVVMNESGYMKHLSRLKDVVIRGGENVYPREVEDFLHHNEKIADVYVVGVPDKRMGEELCACVKLVPNEKMTAEELKSFCENKIAHFKIPRYVEFMNEFPMTVTGKIQKNKLREIVIQKLGLPSK